MPAPIAITSRQHAFVRRCRDVAARRQDDDAVLLDGVHLCEAAVEAGVPLEGLLTDGRAPQLVGRARARGVVIFEGTMAVLEAASPVQTTSGVVAVATWTPSPIDAVFDGPSAFVVGLVDVQDPGNVGAAIRSADALGATGVLALGSSADPGGWKALRGAMGSTFRVPVGRAGTDEAIALVQSLDVRVAAASAHGGTPIDRADLTPPLLLLVGNEGAGLSPALVERAASRLSIPMHPDVESLNVATTVALLLYEARRQRTFLSQRPR
jgi:TrmH family RNA methyltransferase